MGQVTPKKYLKKGIGEIGSKKKVLTK